MTQRSSNAKESAAIRAAIGWLLLYAIAGLVVTALVRLVIYVGVLGNNFSMFPTIVGGLLLVSVSFALAYKHCSYPLATFGPAPTVFAAIMFNELFETDYGTFSPLFVLVLVLMGLGIPSYVGCVTVGCVTVALRRRRQRKLGCCACGYDLKGLPGPVCPECAAKLPMRE